MWSIASHGVQEGALPLRLQALLERAVIASFSPLQEDSDLLTEGQLAYWGASLVGCGVDEDHD